MVNHPNRSKKLRWTRDGDQWVATGTIGEYRVTEWSLSSGPNFVVTVNRRSGSKKTIGEMSSLANAKQWALEYDGYRATA